MQSSVEPKETIGGKSSRKTESRRFSQSILSIKDIQNLKSSKNSQKGVSKRGTDQIREAEQIASNLVNSSLRSLNASNATFSKRTTSRNQFERVP